MFQHWDCFDPDWHPGGIWRPVRLETTGAVRIRALRVLCRERFGIEPAAVTGPATDNLAGTRIIEDELGVPAINARTEGGRLSALVREALGLGGVAAPVEVAAG